MHLSCTREWYVSAPDRYHADKKTADRIIPAAGIRKIYSGGGGGLKGNRTSGLILDGESKSNALRINSSSLEMGGFPKIAEKGQDKGGEKAMTVEFCSCERK